MLTAELTSEPLDSEGHADAAECAASSTCPSSTCPCGQIGCLCLEGCCEDLATCDNGRCVLERGGMVYVPEGPFMMGCLEGVDTDMYTEKRVGPCPEEDLPFREVVLSAFWIDRLEVTKGDYRRCVEAGTCVTPVLWDEEWRVIDLTTNESKTKPGLDTMPVGSIRWVDANAYCEWAGKRLPTEAEWEKAARGTDARKYTWGNEEPDCTRCNGYPYDVATRESSLCDFHAWSRTFMPVGMFPAGMSPYGVHDMAGNATEWVNDGFIRGIGYVPLPDRDPQGLESERYKVKRGGGYQGAYFGGGGYTFRASSRRPGDIESSSEELESGFRCVRSSGESR